MLVEAEVKELLSIIRKSNNIVLTCHVRPDGDAIGSTLGLFHLLSKLGKNPSVVVPDQPPKTLSFLPGFKDIAIYTKYDPYCTRLVNEADLIICCDFNKPSRQDLMAPLIQDSNVTKVLIDHHQDPDFFADLTFSYPEMSSTCELVFRLIAAMGLYPDVNKEAAECILTGMITDTRNFTVNIKHVDIYEILMKLLECGADKEYIVRQALLLKNYSSVKIQAYAINERMEILPKHHAAITTLDKESLERFHYDRGDTEGLVNIPLEIRGVVCSFFLREDPEFIRISARSICNYPVSKVCEELFGGGGHLQASGAEFKGSLKECKEILVKALPKYDRYLPAKTDKIELW